MAAIHSHVEKGLLPDFTSSGTRPRSASIDSDVTLGRDGEANDDLLELDLIDLTIEDGSHVQHRLNQDGERSVDHGTAAPGTIRVGDFVEVANVSVFHGTKRSLKQAQAPLHFDFLADFVLVMAVIETQKNRTFVRGVPFVRARNLECKLPKKLNEVCMVSLSNQPSYIQPQPPTYVDVPMLSIRQKRTLVTTNAAWPTHNPREHAYPSLPRKADRREAAQTSSVLVCRWSYEIYPLRPLEKITGNSKLEEVIRRIRQEEVVDESYRASDLELREHWRKGTRRGGSWQPKTNDVRRTLRRQRTEGQKYTLFDSFCGGGGVSQGAQKAGFKPLFSVDAWEEACNSYQANFPDVTIFRGDVAEFVQQTDDFVAKVDVLHLSPPCQYFSPAHTRESAKDEANIDALKCCQILVQRTRPRIVTLEQTFGITHPQHEKYWRSLLNDFTSLGLSLRWQVVQLPSWGAAQTRKRLIMIAAAPGEKLPPFPRPSHGEDLTGGLSPLRTVAVALRQIDRIHPGEDDLHDLRTVRKHDPPRAPYSADQLAGTITTGGAARNYLPDGSRDFTERELACIQGFPLDHKFLGSSKGAVRTQIGNAFPPNTVRHLYKHLEAWLLEQDQMMPWKPQTSDLGAIETVQKPTNSIFGKPLQALPQVSPQKRPLLVYSNNAWSGNLTTNNRLEGEDTAIIDLTT